MAAKRNQQYQRRAYQKKHQWRQQRSGINISISNQRNIGVAAYQLNQMKINRNQNRREISK